jgi:hypothetical protein
MRQLLPRAGELDSIKEAIISSLFARSFALPARHSCPPACLPCTRRANAPPRRANAPPRRAGERYFRLTMAMDSNAGEVQSKTTAEAFK